MLCEGCGKVFVARTLCNDCLKKGIHQVCAVCGEKGRTLAIAFDGTRFWFCGRHVAYAELFHPKEAKP